MENIKNPFNETNFKIKPVNNQSSFLVYSDSERFGKNAIVYQNTSYEECLKYIEDRESCIEPSYYIISDLSTWANNSPQKAELERFNTVNEAIDKFNSYRNMDYLKESVLNSQTNEPMSRLVLGVSYLPFKNVEMDLIHVIGNETVLISDAVGLHNDGCYSTFMTNKSFVDDLNEIISKIKIDKYSFYRERTKDECVTERLNYLEKNYPDEVHTREEALATIDSILSRKTDYLKNQKVREKIDFKEFSPGWKNQENFSRVRRKSR